ncbi:MAG: sulfite exporter TauE/SafE family protein, partial [Magnetococcales bacterium]|nr:sulfite exporter TauE/SafE family protein [Magnetococcales bacterium]
LLRLLGKLAFLDRLGVPLWHKIQTLTGGLLPITSPQHAFLMGLAWGLIPCGVVYSVVLWNATVAWGNPVQVGLGMFFFGLGTLPATLGGSLLGNRFTFLQNTRFRPLNLALLIMLITITAGFNTHFTWHEALADIPVLQLLLPPNPLGDNAICLPP